MNTIGADPELFVQQGDTIVSAIGMIGGSKEQPRPVPLGAVQEDNVLAEFNIDPCTTAEEFVAAISTVTTSLSEIVAPCTLTVQASHLFDIEELNKGGEKAFEFGCDPDLNAWTEEMNEPPQCVDNLRTAGGHVHIGYDLPTCYRSTRIARMCDFLLGVPSVLLDEDNVRRSLYGAAGAIRIKAYGVEYRVLSNFWLSSELFQRYVFQQANLAVEMEQHLEEYLDSFDAETVQACINNSDKEMARTIIDTLKIPMP